MSALCLTLAERSLSTLRERIRHYAGRVTFIEVRLDHLSEPSRIPRLPASRTRFIATCRPKSEGGLYDGGESERLRILASAARNGFAWVDLERGAFYDAAALEGVSVLRSHHDFGGCPADLPELFDQMGRLPGQGVKIAATPAGAGEAVQLLRWTESLPEGPTRVLLGMGDAGQPTRVLAPLLGSLWTYVAESSDRTVAPGQFTLAQAVGLLRYETWSLPHRRPAFYAVLTRSDACFPICRILNRLFGQAGLDAACLPLQVADAEAWLDYLEGSTLHFRGLALAGASASRVVHASGGSPVAGRGIDTLRRTEAGWQGGSTGVECPPAEPVPTLEPELWADWVLAQFRFWSGLAADRTQVIADLGQAEKGESVGG